MTSPFDFETIPATVSRVPFDNCSELTSFPDTSISPSAVVFYLAFSILQVETKRLRTDYAIREKRDQPEFLAS